MLGGLLRSPRLLCARADAVRGAASVAVLAGTTALQMPVACAAAAFTVAPTLLDRLRVPARRSPPPPSEPCTSRWKQSRRPVRCSKRRPPPLGEVSRSLRRSAGRQGRVATPDLPPDDLIPGFLAASDVLGTGWFAAMAAEAGPGKTVAVVGDGAVGLLGVLAAKQLGAQRIIAMSRHEPRQKPALDFGATDIVTERGDDGAARIKDLTDGLGAHSVIEAVGTQESMI
jgi:hypothetical protein